MAVGSNAFVGVELGGTKCVCVLGTGPDDIRAQETVPTRDAPSTLAAIGAILECWQLKFGRPLAIGVASFGPLHLQRNRPAYGCIGNTPKAGWAGVNIAHYLSECADAPLGLTTDVVGAALAEGRWGSAVGLSDFAYVTVGTGVGVGLIVAGNHVLGGRHPELGHVRVARQPGDRWPGSCRFHGDCVEGLASGPAIEARTGLDPAALSAESEAWDTVAFALAQLAHILVVSTAPKRILIGGGVVASQPHLFPRIRRLLARSLNDYLDVEELGVAIDDLVAPPGLGALAGPLGALAVAADAYAAATNPAGAESAMSPAVTHASSLSSG